MASPSIHKASKVQTVQPISILYHLMSYYVSLHLLLGLFLPCVLAGSCVKIGPCQCRSDSMTLDLTPLGNMKTNFKYAVPGKEETFFYNPCRPFNMSGASTPPSSCINTLLCQENQNLFYPLGTEKYVEFSGSPEKDDLIIRYQETTGTTGAKVTRHSEILLLCGKGDTPDFTFVGEEPKNNYKFELITKYSCLNKGGISTGSILLILFFVFWVVYIVGGILFLRLAKGARGSEQIPNREFWEDFPLLVRDGIYFVCRGCRAETTYEKI